jgi:hypothetical protein
MRGKRARTSAAMASAAGVPRWRITVAQAGEVRA